MARKVALFKINSMNNVSQLTPEICQINAARGVETTVNLDLNIIMLSENLLSMRIA